MSEGESLRLVRHPRAARCVRRRAAACRAVRACLDGLGLVEAEVPVLAPCAGPEPYLQPVRIDWPGLPGSLWLQSSPELLLKRLLCAGVPSLYSLGPAFRGGREELSLQHQPSFSMLEWYRPGDSPRELEEDCLALGRAVAEALEVAAPARGRSLSVAEALADLAGVDPSPLFAGDTRAFAAAARAAGLEGCRDEHDGTQLLGRCLVERIEPALGRLPGWTFLHAWPADQSALARLDPAHPERCLRVEAYLGGLELANGYAELLDAGELSRRWDALLALHQGDAPPRDEALLRELAESPPAPSVGMAMGFDRLLVALQGAPGLSAVLPFRWELDGRPGASL